MAIESINPATEEVLERFDEYSQDQVEQALSRARQAFASWSRAASSERGEALRRAARVLRADKARLGRLITVEMGKPIVEAEAEVEKCAWTCDYFADHGAEFLADQTVKTNARESLVVFDPLGVILAVMPWNFPLWQALRAAAPALMAGNTMILKHASNVPQCALAIEEVFRAAGFPQGVFQTLLVSSRAVEPIIRDARIAAVTLTGSSEAGRQVATTAGHALKKQVLELGGSDPFIILEDADMDGAVEFAVRARYQNAGQSCIAAKRFIVVERRADEFVERFVAAVRELRVGDPLDRATQVGPLARGDLRDDLERQVRESAQAGARVMVGGERLAGRGFFYAPTVVTDVQPDMPVFQEETFGPVAAVMRVRDAEEAVQAANNSMYGLGGNLWTQDTERGKALARRIETGNVFINGMTASDPRLPFGGVKQSGYGRELAVFGIREFTNIKTVWVGPAEGAQSPLPAE